MRLNPRRLAVARIDMSGSINHQMLLKDARAEALRGGGLFARQVGVSKKVDTVSAVLFSFEQRQDALLAPALAVSPRTAGSSSIGGRTWGRDATRRREGGRAGGALKEDKPSKGTSCLQRVGHVFYNDTDELTFTLRSRHFRNRVCFIHACISVV